MKQHQSIQHKIKTFLAARYIQQFYTKSFKEQKVNKSSCWHSVSFPLFSGLSPCTDYQFSVEYSPGSLVARSRAPVTVWTSSARTLVSLDIRVAMGYNTANISAFYRSEILTWTAFWRKYRYLMKVSEAQPPYFLNWTFIFALTALYSFVKCL